MYQSAIVARYICCCHLFSSLGTAGPVCMERLELSERACVCVFVYIEWYFVHRPCIWLVLLAFFLCGHCTAHFCRFIRRYWHRKANGTILCLKKRNTNEHCDRFAIVPSKIAYDRFEFIHCRFFSVRLKSQLFLPFLHQISFFFCCFGFCCGEVILLPFRSELIFFFE